MINNFHKVIDGVYRGSAPDIEDVRVLKDKYKIKKIISLDNNAAHRINRACKLLHIEHIIIPIDVDDRSSILKILKYDIRDLFLKNGPVFIHCIHGKDRTGFLVALFRVMIQGWEPEKALQEALSFGFGIGIPVNLRQSYIKLLNESKWHNVDLSEASDTYGTLSFNYDANTDDSYLVPYHENFVNYFGASDSYGYQINPKEEISIIPGYNTTDDYNVVNTTSPLRTYPYSGAIV